MAQWRKKEANLLKKLKTDEEKQQEEEAKASAQKTPTTKRGGRTQVKVRTKPEHPSKRPKQSKKSKPTEEEIK